MFNQAQLSKAYRTGAKSLREALVIDAAVNVALLGLSDGALVPRPGGGELTGAQQAVAHLVQASAAGGVIDAAVNVALLLGGDGALAPRPCGGELTGARQAVAHLVQA